MKITIDWNDVLLNPEQVHELVKSAGKKTTLAVLKSDFEVEFVPFEDVQERRNAGAHLPEETWETISKARTGGRGQYDPTRHLIVYCAGNLGFDVPQRGAEPKPIRFAWLKPKRGGYRRINLEQDADAIRHQAYEA